MLLYCWGFGGRGSPGNQKQQIGGFPMNDDSDRKATTAPIGPSSSGAPASASRRRALARLGLATAVAYSVPTLVRIDRSARAIVLPSPCDDPPNFPPGSPPPFCPGGGGGPPP
jgi:hypothetical protein